MNAIRTILIIIFAYYTLKFVVKLFFPLLLKYFVTKAQDNFQGKMNPNSPPPTNKPEGEITIEKKLKSDNKPKEKSRGNNDYIDFEEIK